MATSSDTNSTNSSTPRNLSGWLFPAFFLLFAVLKLLSQDYAAAGVWGSLGAAWWLLGQAKRHRWAAWAAGALLALAVFFTYLKAQTNRPDQPAPPAASNR